MRFDIEAIEQRIELMSGQGDRRTITLLRPVELMLFKAFVVKTKAIRFPKQNLDPVTPVVAEHIGGGSKRVVPQPLFNQQGESVDALAAIYPFPVQEDLQPGIESEHGRVDSS